MGWFTRNGRVLVAWIWLVVLGAAGPAAAHAPLLFEPDRQPVMLLDAGEVWLEEAGTMRVEEVAADARIRWRPSSATDIYRLDKGEALWIRFIVPPTPNSERWYLEIPYPGVDRVSLYVQNGAGEWMERTAGDTVPISTWPLPHRHPMMPVAVSPLGPREHYVRVQNGTIFGAPMQFVSDNYIMRQEQGISLALGIYFGLVVLAVMLSLAGAITLKDHVYTLYAVSAVLMALTQATITGLAGLHVWGEWPWWNNMAPQVLPLFAIASLQLFLAELVSLRERSRLLYRLLVTAGLLSLPLSVYLMVTPEVMERLRLIVAYFLAETVAGLGVVVWSALRGDRYAPWLLVGAAPVAIGALFPLARAAGLIPIGFWTTHGMQLAIAAELPILLLVMVLRSQHRREHVRRIQGLDRIDPSTGLINAAVFHERLVRLIARSQRLKFRSAVLLVDLSNIEQIKRQFDSESARELTLRVAGRLLSVAREIDTVARLSEHRFGVLLEGPLHADEVAEAGPRIVARCLMPFKGHPLEWSAHVRVAQALIPMDGTDPAQLLGRLEMLLASAPADSRRAVFMLSKSGALPVFAG
ncbi:MAG TPA: 7TM diverse intracellular signaling domain-containing protein [Ramlibacter sp.]|uniref:sensor domain-containing diguanylate cyclase n=1 Tax=Ramlibacter sp. TaxID=1917967 RepID=UPI002D7E7B87|nr:7TM diverse intracellular signaling domain-containing protein [Ramlibacter sp.]HET8745700.1 7TM diverse intracellular signaling domain-containing protein [Ramlibacter sp.]